jgi:hypothetical protein
METSLQKSCLGSLYLANKEAIQSACKFNKNQVCQAKNMIQIKSGHTVSIDSGCYIQTMDHAILVDESETVEIQKKTMEFDWGITEFFGRANTEGINQAIQ